MFGVEKDISPLHNRIEEVERGRDALANKVAGLEQQLQGQGVSIDQQQLHIQIRELKRQVEEKDRETEALKKALQNAPTPATAVELPGVRSHPPSPIQYPPNPGRPGWGYRGGGGCTGPGSGVGLLNALQTGGSVGYEPDGFGPDSGYPQYSGANVPHSDPVYVESVTSPEALDQNMKSKLCPVYKAQGRSVFMTPAKLYGARVDINECGIWFDKGELLEIISKLKGGILRDLGSLIKGWSHEKGQINDQRNKLVEMRKEYDAGYVRFIELDKIVQTGGPEKDKKIHEYRALANELRQKAAKLREGVDITPGKTVVFPEGKKPGGGHTDLKFCPVALARGQKIIMARVKLMDEDIDVSEHGLWFDPNELVKIIKIVQKKEGGILDGVKRFLRGQGIIEKLKEEVEARIEKVKERDETHRQLNEKSKIQQFGPEYKELQEKYSRLNRELDDSVDITPGWLR